MKSILFFTGALVSIIFAPSCAGDKSCETAAGTEQSKPKETTMDASTTAQPKSYSPQLNSYIGEVLKEMETISPERKELLHNLTQYIRTKKEAGGDINLTYICTHNSRRSHLSQLWGMVAADYYGVEHVKTFSGGTEATAFNPRAVAAVERAGFLVSVKQEGENPLYEVAVGEGGVSTEAFSKVYDEAPNPQTDFAAVMTCTHADENCPYIPGAQRISLPYDDPKEFDGTDLEAAKYDERCKQIAGEMFYAFSQVNK